MNKTPMERFWGAVYGLLFESYLGPGLLVGAIMWILVLLFHD